MRHPSVRRLKLVELTPYARINLIVALAVAAHAALYAVADVGGGQEDYPAFPLKTVIEVDEVVKHIVVKLVAFVENQQGLSICIRRSIAVSRMSRSLMPALRNPTFLAISLTKSPLRISSSQSMVNTSRFSEA